MTQPVKTKKRVVKEDVVVKTIPTAQGLPSREAYSWHTFPLGSKWAEWTALAIIALVPFHAFFTVWASTTGLDYDIVRLWQLVPLTVLAVLCSYWLWRDESLRKKLLAEFIPRTMLVFAGVLGLFTYRAVLLEQVSTKAALLGLFLDLRYFAFFLAVYSLVKYRRNFLRRWVAVIVTCGVLVSAFAVLQYVALPDNFLSHFGYSAATIDAVGTINNDPNYLRVSSFLRGANPLGAYLVLILTLLVVFRRWWKRPSVWALTVGVVLAALVFSYSRSAWLGFLAAMAVLFALRLKSEFSGRHVAAILLGMLFLTGVIFTWSTQNTTLQNAIYHTNDQSTVELSSNEQRASALRLGAQDVLQTPMGRGAGSAGPASVHNTLGPTRIAENQYLQIGQEGGWASLLIYIVITITVGFTLWRYRSDPYAKALFAAFVGLIVVNMLSHAWVDETLSYIWWGLAGAVIGGHAWVGARQTEKNEPRS